MLDPQLRYVVGIDVAKLAHVYCVIEVASGAVRGRARSIPATQGGHQELLAALRPCGAPAATWCRRRRRPSSACATSWRCSSPNCPRDLISALRRLAFDGRFAGKRHQFMLKGTHRLRSPNPHQGTIAADLLAEILRQGNIDRAEWERI